MRVNNITSVNIFTKKPGFCAATERPDNSRMQTLSKDEFRASGEKHISNLANIQRYPVRAVFSDIDGTILHDHKPVKKNLEGVKSLEEAGIPLILATGRNRTEVQPTLDLLGIKHPSYLITEQGGTVFKGDKIIFKDTMSVEDTLSTIKYAQECAKKDENIQILVHINGHAYTTSKKMGDEYPHAQDTVRVVGSFDEALAQGMPTKIMLFKADSASIDELNDARDYLRENLKGRDLNIFNSGRPFCEVTNKSVSKGKAIRIIAQDMGIELKNTAALGDAENDMEMIKLLSEEGGVSVAMGNAISELKARARVITDDVAKGGFKLAIDAMLLVNGGILQHVNNL